MKAALRLTLWELRRDWQRPFVSALAVMLGVASLIAADLLSQAVTAEIDRSAEAQAVTAFLSEQLNVGLSAIGLVIAMGAGFIIYNSMAMSLSQRMDDLGRLRAVGMTRGQVISAILIEALLIGGVGAIIGILAGPILSKGLMRFMESTSAMFNQFGASEISLPRIAMAALLGVAITLVAALVPARQASRVSPLAMLQRAEAQSNHHQRRTPIGLPVGLASALLAGLLLFPPARWVRPPWDVRLSVMLLFLWCLCFFISLPSFIGVFATALEKPFWRILGAPGKLGIQNSRRARQRVAYTVLTLAIGVAMIVGATGYITFWFDELFFRTMEVTFLSKGFLGLFPLNLGAGLQAYTQVKQFTIPTELVGRLQHTMGSRAVLAKAYFVLIPELSFLGESYFSYVLDPQEIQDSGELFFRFAEGDWERAMPILKGGCGLLLTPVVASRNHASLSDSIRVMTPQGPVDCIVAGIGSTYAAASIVSDSILDAYGLTAPVALLVLPRAGIDQAALQSELMGIVADYEGVWLADLDLIYAMQITGMKNVQSMMSGMLILAILAAALGAVSVIRIGLHERRREFALLRAVGATRRQVRAVVLSEAALIGLAGGCAGLLLGLGMVLVYTLVTGGGFMGIGDFPVMEAAFSSLIPATRNGLLALLLAPAVTCLSAWMATRRLPTQIRFGS